MSKEVIIYNELHKILNRKYMYLSCYKEDDTEICLKADKFILPEFRPSHCKDWSDIDE